jgi:hypothetical protein
VTTWHATPAELSAYQHGSDDSVLAASIEAHLLACSRCREVLAGNGDVRSDTARRWEDLTSRLDEPSAARWSALQRSGVTRPSLSTRPLVIAWVAAVGLLLMMPLIPLLVGVAGGTTVLLAAAPLAPMIAVVLAYRQATDPAGELALATPMAGFRLVATRAMTVALTATPVAVAAALLLELPTYVAVGWLLPGVALAALVLVAGTLRVDPAVTAGVLGAAWALLIVLPTLGRRATADVVAQAVASPDSQLLALAVAALALALAVTRRDHITYRRTL